MEFSTAIFIVAGACFSAIIVVASVIKALKEIEKNALAPIRKRLNEKLFTPLEVLAVEITEIKNNVVEIKGKHTEEIGELREIIDNQAFNIAFLNFKDSFAFHHNSSKAYFITNEFGRLEYINTAFCELFDIDSSQIEQRYFHELPCKTDKLIIRRFWQETIREQTMYENSHVFLRRDKQELHLLIKAEPFIYKGEIKKFLGFIEKLGEKQ
jgi:PAS domain-containing protein